MKKLLFIGMLFAPLFSFGSQHSSISCVLDTLNKVPPYLQMAALGAVTMGTFMTATKFNEKIQALPNLSDNQKNIRCLVGAVAAASICILSVYRTSSLISRSWPSSPEFKINNFIKPCLLLGSFLGSAALTLIGSWKWWPKDVANLKIDGPSNFRKIT